MNRVGLLGAGILLVGSFLAALVYEVGSAGYPMTTKVALGMIVGGGLMIISSDLPPKFREWRKRWPP